MNLSMFPPSSLGHDNDVHFDFTVHDPMEVLEWMTINVGTRNLDWWYPIRGLVVAREKHLAVLAKLTWG